MNSKSFVESKQKKKEKHENIKTAKRIYKSLQKYKTKTMFEEKKARNDIPLNVVPLGCSGGQWEATGEGMTCNKYQSFTLGTRAGGMVCWSNRESTPRDQDHKWLEMSYEVEGPEKNEVVFFWFATM